MEINECDECEQQVRKVKAKVCIKLSWKKKHHIMTQSTNDSFNVLT